MCAIIFSVSYSLRSEEIDTRSFDDSPIRNPIQNPAWFKVSFLDFKDDVNEARDSNKKAILIYFGQKYCPYCKQFLDNNFSKKDILHYTKKNFDVIAINVRGNRSVTNLAGKSMDEKQFAISQGANFTPSLLFINLKGKKVLKLVGYQPPYRFRAAMEYVADKHYKKESYSAYLRRAVRDDSVKIGKLNKQPFILKAVTDLSKKRAKPLLVMFEQSDCHSCDLLHASPLKKKESLDKLKKFSVVQLNMWSENSVITPKGKRVVIKKWAEKLNVNYAPTLIFFDPNGKEVMRSESVMHFYRLNSVLQFIVEKAYLKYKNYAEWKLQKSPK